MTGTITEGRHTAEFMVSEANGLRSRDALSVYNATGAQVTLPAGLVLAKQAFGTVTTAFSGTGNGTITMDVSTPLLANAQVGDYKATCTVASTNAATFRITDPTGDVLGDISFSGSGATAAFADQIKFVITDGGTDFAVGAVFTVTVPASSTGYLVPYTGAGVAGAAQAAAILWDNVTLAATTAKKATVITRAAEVNSAELQWDAAVTGSSDPTPAALKAAALVQLAALGIVGR